MPSYTTPAISDSFLEEEDDDVQEGCINDDTQPSPDLYSLDMIKIYDELNPSTAVGKEKLHKWRIRVVDVAGNPIRLIGIVANQLLKVLV
jgi:hypothetical protein